MVLINEVKKFKKGQSDADDKEGPAGGSEEANESAAASGLMAQCFWCFSVSVSCFVSCFCEVHSSRSPMCCPTVSVGNRRVRPARRNILKPSDQAALGEKLQ